MSWVYLTIISAVLLGLYDTSKKKALEKNDTLTVLAVTTGLSTCFLIPFFSIGTTTEYLQVALKSVLVTISWVSGLYGMKLLPLTTASLLKASRPLFVVIFSLIIFSERLSPLQWAATVIVLLSIYLLSRSSKKEGIDFLHSRGFWAMVVSILSGVVSALYDKHIMMIIDPKFVQSWTSLMVTVEITLLIFGIKCYERLACRKALAEGCEEPRSILKKFTFDWYLIAIAVLITGADFVYFKALSMEDALLSIVSLVRRGSVCVTFICGAIFFKEKKIKEKGFELLLLLLGLTLLTVATLV